MSTSWVFNHIENKHTLYGEKDCMKKFYESLREHANNIIDLKKKKNVNVNKRRIKLHQDAKVCYICRRQILKNLPKSKNYGTLRDHCHYTGKYRGAAHNICILKSNVLNEIPVVFHNGLNYDYHFLMKELAKELEGELECLGENTEKYKTYSVPLEKEVTKIDKNSNESVVTISYKNKIYW